METLIKKHIHKFNKKPNIIGMYWNNQEAIMDGILKAIEDNNPYDEYKMLSKEDRVAYDKGELLF